MRTFQRNANRDGKVNFDVISYSVKTCDFLQIEAISIGGPLYTGELSLFFTANHLKYTWKVDVVFKPIYIIKI